MLPVLDRGYDEFCCRLCSRAPSRDNSQPHLTGCVLLLLASACLKVQSLTFSRRCSDHCYLLGRLRRAFLLPDLDEASVHEAEDRRGIDYLCQLFLGIVVSRRKGLTLVIGPLSTRASNILDPPSKTGSRLEILARRFILLLVRITAVPSASSTHYVRKRNTVRLVQRHSENSPSPLHLLRLCSPEKYHKVTAAPKVQRND